MADDDNFPGTVLTRTGKQPAGFIVHHTAGRGDPAGVVNWWKKQGQGLGSQYIMDRNGVIHDTAKEFGYKGTGQIARGYGKIGAGLSNDNTIGMEIVAKDDKDVTPQQAEAFAKFIAARYPTTKLYGHGQVNPNDRQSTEGMTALNAAMALRNQSDGSGVQVASLGNTPIGTVVNAANAPVAGALARPSGGGFMSSVSGIESNDRNIPSGVDKDYPGQPGSKSQGYWQIDTPTWLQFATKAGIDTKQFPNAMSAPRDIQEQVARQIPLSRFGGRTVRMLTQQYGTLDKSMTLGALDAKYGGGAPGAAAVSSSTGNTAPTTVTPAAPAADQPWWQQAYGKIVGKPVDAQGNPTGEKSPYENLAEAFQKGPARMKALEEDQAPEQVKNYTGTAPPARNVSTGLQNVAQTYGQTLNSFSQPLTWNDAPPQAPQALAGGFRPSQAGQVPGMSLNSVQPGAYGLGYGINPVGYGFG